ncbi:MAG TPA: ELWxxDGT repeat protein [Tepidisphaeraceae bacterium]|nr:ELWxxDGT repeat protein [Tepidisphaeraceae bacterium]
MGRTQILQPRCAYGAEGRRSGQGRRDRQMLRSAIGPCVEGLEDRRLLSAVLVKDLDPQPMGSSPEQVIQIGNMAYFTADDGIHGRELWKTDGTPGGTRLVKDIQEGYNGLACAALANLNGTLFFLARDSEGSRLWKSDGTDAGTVPVTRIGADGASLAAVGNFVTVGQTLYFVAGFDSPGKRSEELWRTDGTPEGTSRVSVLQTKTSLSGQPVQIVGAGGMVFFVLSDPEHGAELWKSDGTETGTAMVKDINAGTAGSSIADMVAVGEKVFFSANDGVHGQELWASDGSDAGTVLVKDIKPGSGGSKLVSFCSHGGKLFFAADDGDHGLELWGSDGMEAGTTLVKDIAAGRYGSNPVGLVSTSQGLFFGGRDENYVEQLWRSDGTAEGTAPVSNVPGGLDVSYPLGEVQGVLYFMSYGYLGRYGSTQLWKSDGTAEGTVELAQVRLPAIGGLGSRGCGNAILLHGRLVFTATDASAGNELWTSDGTVGGTGVLTRINLSTLDSYLTAFGSLGGTLLFGTRDGLWRSDGTAGGTRQIADLPVISSIVSTDTVAYIGGSGLWRTDGTPGGTVLLKDVGKMGEMILIDGRLFFTGRNDATGSELWTSDGTPEGTVMVKDILPGAAGSEPFNFVNVNGTLYFLTRYPEDRDGGVYYARLWKSDGTAEGTVQVSDSRISITSFDGMGTPLGSIDNAIFFTARDSNGTVALWRTDGTPAGTTVVKDHLAGSGFVNVNGTLFFQGYDREHGDELWKSDGTPEGTVLVKDINPAGDRSSSPRGLTIANGRVFFAANDGVHGEELWITDGTAAGTRMVKDMDPFSGMGRGLIRDLTPVGNLVFFAAESERANDYNWVRWSYRELWCTDGTPEGTFQVKDIMPGVRGCDPQGLTSINGTLFFSADDGVHGTELWAVASPKADAGGPYTFSINTSVVLSGMGSSDSDPTEMLTYEWDLDGDGIFGEVGSNAARGDEFGREVAFRRPPGYQPGTYTVSLRVSNSVGLSGTATTSVTLREAGFVGTAGDDSLILRSGSHCVLLYQNGSDVPILTASQSAFPVLQVAGNGGNDVLTIDCSSGDLLSGTKLQIDSGSIRLRLAGGSSVLRTKEVSIGAQASLDLGDNTLVVLARADNREAVLAQISSYIRSGVMTSSAKTSPRMGLAAICNDCGNGQLVDPSLDANAILVKCTWNGDVNLDGKVDIADYFLVDSGFIKQTGGYRNGDLNYDGKVDIRDYFLIDSAFIGQKVVPGEEKVALALSAREVPSVLEGIFGQEEILA